MSKVLWHTTMSLDGFVAGPDDAMDWAFGDDLGPSPSGDAVPDTAGAILAGRRWFDLSLARPGWRPYGGTWHGSLFVLTHRPPPPLTDDEVTFLGGDIGDAVATARTAAGGKDVVLFGPTVARQCLDAGLVDEILVHIVPVLLGDGVRFFDRPGVRERVRLHLTGVAASGQLTDLRLTVAR
jgi:dihydrofolate reductase